VGGSGRGKTFFDEEIAFLSSRAGQECIFWRRGYIFDALFGEGVVFLTSQAGQVYIFDEGVAFSTSSSANMRQKCEPLARKCVENAHPEAKIGSRGPRGARSSEPLLAKGSHFCCFDGQFLLKGSHFWRYFWRRGAISGPVQRTTNETPMDHNRWRSKKWSSTHRPETITQHAVENATPASENATMQPPNALGVGESH